MFRDPVFGIGLMIQTMNDWMKEFGQRRECTLVRYEDLRQNRPRQFRRILTALGEKDRRRHISRPPWNFRGSAT